MKDNDEQMTQGQLEALIERYFDGDTTVDDEAVLRQALAQEHWQGAAIDEARFAMGYYSMTQPRTEQGSKWQWPRRWAVAASVAVLLMAGGKALYDRHNQCVAWVGGEAIHNSEQVMNLIASDLGAMATADNELQQGMFDQLVVED